MFYRSRLGKNLLPANKFFFVSRMVSKISHTWAVNFSFTVVYLSIVLLYQGVYWYPPNFLSTSAALIDTLYLSHCPPPLKNPYKYILWSKFCPTPSFLQVAPSGVTSQLTKLCLNCTISPIIPSPIICTFFFLLTTGSQKMAMSLEIHLNYLPLYQVFSLFHPPTYPFAH